jgi:nicotinamidase-related amidase
MSERSPLQADLEAHLPIRFQTYEFSRRTAGLVIVDEIHGFCTPGAGALAPQAHDPQIALMIVETDRLARRFAAEKRPILAFLDTHEPGKPEFPYPLHCEAGSGEEHLVPELEWLEDCNGATLLRKDCIDGFIGGIEPSFVGGAHGQYHNKVVDWINSHRLDALIVVGICTDICVMDFVLTMLSARNHGLMPTLKDVVVLEPACATYDLPMETGRELGLPATAAHPQGPSHHIGLYTLAARGAVLATEIQGL